MFLCAFRFKFFCITHVTLWVFVLSQAPWFVPQAGLELPAYISCVLRFWNLLAHLVGCVVLTPHTHTPNSIFMCIDVFAYLYVCIMYVQGNQNPLETLGNGWGRGKVVKVPACRAHVCSVVLSGKPVTVLPTQRCQSPLSFQESPVCEFCPSALDPKLAR